MNSRLIGLIKAFFIFIFVFYTIVSIGDINNEIRKLEEEKKKIDDILVDIYNNLINLSERNKIFLHLSGYQEMGEGGLYVAIESVDPHLTGLKIKGEILNALAVDRGGLSFKVHVGDKSGDFFIDEIPSGVAKKFEVYIPDADKDAKYAIFEYKSGVVKYYERK